jgi:hypothetical protein
VKKLLLENLYLGNLSPVDKGCLNNPKLRQLMDIAADNEEKLLELLKDEDRDLFVSFSEAQTDLNFITNQERYIDGFCTGLRLAIEVLSYESIKMIHSLCTCNKAYNIYIIYKMRLPNIDKIRLNEYNYKML